MSRSQLSQYWRVEQARAQPHPVGSDIVEVLGESASLVASDLQGPRRFIWAPVASARVVPVVEELPIEHGERAQVRAAAAATGSM